MAESPRCNICKKVFTTIDEVERHINTYHKVTCDKCGAIFYRTNNLREHILDVHEGMGGSGFRQRGSGVAEYTDDNYDIFKTATRETSSGLQENSYNIIFKKKDHSDADTLLERMAHINSMIGGVVDIFKEDLTDVDTIQFILFGQSLKSVFSTPFTAKKDFTRESIKNQLCAFLNSNENFVLNREMNLDVKIVRGQGGRGSSAKTFHNMPQLLARKRCIIKLKNTDNLCFAKSLTLVYYKHRLNAGEITPTFWKMVSRSTRKNPFLQTKSEMFHAAAGLPPNTQVRIGDIKKFEKSFKKFQLNVYHFKNGVIEKLFSGKNVGAPTLDILYHVNHYYPILSLKAFKAVDYICEHCGHASTNQLFHHICKKKCFSCHSVKHDVLDTNCLIKCVQCRQDFYTELCYTQHLKKIYSHNSKSVCDIYQKCAVCGFVHNISEGCEKKRYCEYCQLPVYGNHDCYINGSTKPERYRNYLIYDIESRLEKISNIGENIHTVHIPNLICSRLLCTDCKEGVFSLECEKCEIRFFERDPCVREFLDYVGGLKNVCCLGHNASSYDNVLLLRELWNVFPHKKVSIIPCGNSVMSMSIGDEILFRDTNLFFKSRLANLPKFFGFADISKGLYPYVFNCEANYEYEGLLPSIEHYATANMSVSEKSDFLAWYRANQHKQFDFWQELRSYCLSDVNLLAKAVNIYRKNNIKYGVEPFNCVTVAHLTYTLFTKAYLQRDKIARLPMKKHNTSVKCENWLQYYAETHDASILPEYRIPKTPYIADGFIEDSRTILEFLGCFYHGHILHYAADDAVVGGMPAAHVFKSTLDRLHNIRELGYKVVTIWECEYDNLVRENEDYFKYRPPTLNIRSALYGGRCEVYSVYNDMLKAGKKGRAYDIVSLYPSVMASELFPVGKPELINRQDITQPFQISNYFGVISCEVQPPAQLHVPVLPYKNKSGKLTFPLCRECADMLLLKCTHYGEKCRNLFGAWTTVELKLALEEGYKIIDVFQIYHFSEKSNTLFKGFILEMLRGKMESSGYPKDVTTAADKNQYLETI